MKVDHKWHYDVHYPSSSNMEAADMSIDASDIETAMDTTMNEEEDGGENSDAVSLSLDEAKECCWHPTRTT